MGFWQRNWEKIFADTIAGVFVRLIVPALLGFGGIYIGNKVVSSPIDRDIIKGILIGIFFYRIYVDFYLCPTLTLDSGMVKLCKGVEDQGVGIGERKTKIGVGIASGKAEVPTRQSGVKRVYSKWSLVLQGIAER